MTIVNDDSSIVNKLGASLTDDARVAIYDHHMFIGQATGSFPTPTNLKNGPIISHRFACTLLAMTNTLAYCGTYIKQQYLKHFDKTQLAFVNSSACLG